MIDINSVEDYSIYIVAYDLIYVILLSIKDMLHVISPYILEVIWSCL